MVVMIPYVGFVNDFSKVAIASTVMSRDVGKAAQGSIMMLDADEYGEGHCILNTEDITAYVDDLIGDKYQYTVYTYDQSNLLKEYNNYSGTAQLINSNTITLVSGKYIFDDVTGYEVTITEPCVIVTTEKVGDFYRSGLKSKPIRKSSMYLIDTRNN